MIAAPEKYTPQKDFFLSKRSSKKIHYREDKLLFLRIFKEIRKKLKSGNQFDVATQIKAIFKKANQEGIFEYISLYEYNPVTERYEDFTLLNLELDKKLQKQLELRRKFLKEIGLTEKSFKYLYGSFEFSALNDYFSYATPRAIIQMRKRLLQKQ